MVQRKREKNTSRSSFAQIVIIVDIKAHYIFHKFNLQIKCDFFLFQPNLSEYSKLF